MREKLPRLQKEVFDAPTTELVKAEKEQITKLTELLEVEESFLKQKSRIKWLREGDQNKNYFHRVIQGRISRRKINSLICVDGTIVTDETTTKNKILGNYKRLLGSVCSDISTDSLRQLQGLLSAKLSEDMHEGLIAEVTKEKIYSVIKSMPSNKSPGPDDFTSEFF